MLSLWRVPPDPAVSGAGWMDRRSSAWALFSSLGAACDARGARTKVPGGLFLEPARMISVSPQRVDRSIRNAWPPSLFDQVTDILADLVLEDLKQYPQTSSSLRIDRFSGQENTSLPLSGGEE